MNQTQRSQRWQRRKGARPAEVLDAALAEFFEKGFEAARLEDIAARAGVSKGTIYLYFDSKEDVFEALVKSIPASNVEHLEQMTKDNGIPADVQLRQFLQLLGGVIRDERMSKFPRLLIGEAGRFPHLADIYRREVITRASGVLAAVIERGIADGLFHPVHAMEAAYAAVAPLLFVPIWRTTFERVAEPTLDIEHFVTQHIDTFLRGLGKRTVS